jgi:hypothetical protein
LDATECDAPEITEEAATELQIRDAFDRLPAALRTVLHLRLLGLQVAEISKEMGLSRRSVQHLSVKAIAELKEVLMEGVRSPSVGSERGEESLGHVYRSATPRSVRASPPNTQLARQDAPAQLTPAVRRPSAHSEDHERDTFRLEICAGGASQEDIQAFLRCLDEVYVALGGRGLQIEYDSERPA